VNVIDFETKRFRKLQELAAKFKVVDTNLHILWSKEKRLILSKQTIADQIKSMCPYNKSMSKKCNHPGRNRRRKDVIGKDDEMCLCNISFCPYIEGS